MSATNQMELDVLDLLFTNVDAPFIGDAAGLQNSAAAGSLQISLHTAALSDTDTDATASEAAYTSYAREVVGRSVSDWTVAAGSVSNDAELAFVTATGGTEDEVYFGICLMATGDYLQLWGALDASLSVSSGITPTFAAQALAFTLD
jgi:hypothetical protein